MIVDDQLALDFDRHHHGASAKQTWSEIHFWTIFVFADLMLYLFLVSWRVGCSCLFLVMTAFLLLCISFRLWVVIVGIFVSRKSHAAIVSPLVRRADDDLPTYTILVPMYKEAEVAAKIVSSLSLLDYPRQKLQVLLLLEGDDAITRQAIEVQTLAPEYQIVVVPPGLPRTKPKACNYGLEVATGEFCVVFDAEDRPEPDQLRKAVEAFASVDASVVCLQARLNYFNPRDNFLTKSFAIEYTAWFDLFLPGLQSIDGPIPLGGTSNHFRTEVLQQLHGWDPYNVTEDCDLGVRLAIAGYKTKMLDSTTWEEANSELGNWIRQRSRWAKGYMQTHLVHTKRAFGLIRKLGLRRTALFYLTVTSSPVQQLLNLICWPLTLLFIIFIAGDLFAGRDLSLVLAGSRDEPRLAWKMLYMGYGESMEWAMFSLFGTIASITMLIANLAFIAVNLLATRRRGYSDLFWVALASPVYWLLASIAAWKGFWQLIVNPHYWEKTRHGLQSEESGSLTTAKNLMVFVMIGIGLSCIGCGKSDRPWEDFESVENKLELPPGWELNVNRGSYQTTISGEAKHGKSGLSVAGAGGKCELISAPIAIELNSSLSVTVWVRPRMFALDSRFQISLINVDGSDDKIKLPSRPVETTIDGWQRVRLRYLPEEGSPTRQIALQMTLVGEGVATIDEIRTVTEGFDTAYQIADGGFETTPVGNKPKQWAIRSDDHNKGTGVVQDDRPFNGDRFFRISGGKNWCVGLFEQDIPKDVGKISFEGYVRGIQGYGRLKIEYYKGSEYLGDSLSTAVTGGDWKQLIIEQDDEKVRKADHFRISIAAEKGNLDVKQVLVDFDELELFVQKP